MNRKIDKLNILPLSRKMLLLQIARKPQQDSKLKKEIKENLTNTKNNGGGGHEH